MMNFYLPLVFLIVLYDGSWTAMANDLTTTPRPADPFNAAADATFLQDAISFNNNKTGIIKLLTHRTLVQRLSIAEEFRRMNGAVLKKRLSTLYHPDGELAKAGVVALVTPLVQIYANGLHEAIRHPGIDKNALIEILVPLNNSEVRAVKRSYKKLFDNELEDDIKSVTSGDFQKLLVSLCRAQRKTNHTSFDYQRHSGVIFNIPEGQWSSNGILNTMLTGEHKIDLVNFVDQFPNILGGTVEDVIETEFDEWTGKGYLAIVHWAEFSTSFYAESLHVAMSGERATDPSLVRILLGKYQADMRNFLKQVYHMNYNHTLLEDIQANTSGYYRQILENLIEP